MKSIKADSTKPDFLSMLIGMQHVLDHGARKYGRDNWRKSINTAEHFDFEDRLKAAAIRHITAGKQLDDDSGLLHVDHALTCLWMVREYMRCFYRKIKRVDTFQEDKVMKKATKATKVAKTAKKKTAKKKAVK